jgi:hypothetical protein
MYQPQYSLAINNEYCSFMAYINDVPALYNPDGYAFNMNVPINHIIKSGKNSFRIEVSQLEKSVEAELYMDCKVEILVKGNKEPMSKLKSLSSVSLRQLFGDSVSKLPDHTPLTGVFEVEESFSDLPWNHSSDMSERKSHFIKLAMEKIQEFHNALMSRNLDFVFNSIESRENHYTTSFYESFREGFEKTKNDFNETIEDVEYILQPLDFSNYTPVFHAKGKLITFENSYGEQIVHFLNNTKFTRRQYPLYFSCTENGQLQIAL